jgi:hypothetical protein
MNAMTAGGASGAMDARDRWHRFRWSVVSRPTVVVAVLAPAAVAESVWRSTGASESPQYGLVLSLLAFVTTAPAAFLGVRAAAVVTTIAVVLSIAPFDSLTVAGAVAELYVLDRLRHGPPALPVVLALPFSVLALVAAARDGPSVLTVFLAVAALAAALGGVARTAREEARLPPAGPAADRRRPGRTTSRAASGPASRGTCTTSSRTTSR